MLAHWLQPDPEQARITWSSWQLGAHARSFFPEMNSLPTGSVVLLGYEEKSASAIRRQLWPMAWTMGQTPLWDLGNLRKADHAFAVQLIRELLDGGLTVILIGGPEDLPFSQYMAYSEKMKGVNACLISSRIAYSHLSAEKKPPLLNRMLRSGDNHLFHLSVLGWQRHFTDPAILPVFLQEHAYELTSLGKLSHHIEDVEPIIRDADMVGIHLHACQAAFAPAAIQVGPNGLTGVEICHLARYAGISDKLTSFSVGGWQPARDRQHRTAQLAAQTVWYFLEGFSQRQGDFPVSAEGLIEFKVEHSHLSEALIFWKSSRTGRWWLQVPVREEAGHERHRLVPCTYQDYQEACRDELPERLLQAQLRYR